jgi:hypothetical protein
MRLLGHLAARQVYEIYLPLLGNEDSIFSHLLIHNKSVSTFNLRYLSFSMRWYFKSGSSGLWRRVVLRYDTTNLEDIAASIYRVKFLTVAVLAVYLLTPTLTTHRHLNSFSISEDWTSRRHFDTWSGRSDTSTRPLLLLVSLSFPAFYWLLARLLSLPTGCWLCPALCSRPTSMAYSPVPFNLPWLRFSVTFLSFKANSRV